VNDFPNYLRVAKRIFFWQRRKN